MMDLGDSSYGTGRRLVQVIGLRFGDCFGSVLHSSNEAGELPTTAALQHYRYIVLGVIIIIIIINYYYYC